MNNDIRNYGYKPKPLAARERFATFNPTQAVKDAVARHPEINYKPEMPSIYDQGQHGTCVPHALKRKIAFFSKKRTGKQIDISIRALEYMTKQLKEDGDFTDDGLDPADALWVLQNVGYVNDSDMPYNDGPGFNLFQPVDQSLIRKDFLVKTFVEVPNDLHSVKLAIMAHGTVAVGGPWYEEWERPGSDGKQPMPTASSHSVGGHERLYVGYSDYMKAVLEANSWGPEWGFQGHSWMPYDLFGTPYAPDQIHSCRL